MEPGRQTVFGEFQATNFASSNNDYFLLKQKGQFCPPLNFLIFVPFRDFCDAFCVAGGAFGRHCQNDSTHISKLFTKLPVTLVVSHPIFTGSSLPLTAGRVWKEKSHFIINVGNNMQTVTSMAEQSARHITALQSIGCFTCRPARAG